MNKATQSLAVGEVLRLPTDQINADAIERIGFFHADEVAALADIIASDGQNEPIVVAAPVPKSKDRRYRLVYGRHRHAACAALGIEVLARVVEGTNDELLRMQTAEQIDRRDMTVLERAAFVGRRAEIVRERVLKEAGVESEAALGALVTNLSPATTKALEKLPKDTEIAPPPLPGVPKKELEADTAAVVGRYGWSVEVQDEFGLHYRKLQRLLTIYRGLIKPFRAEVEAIAQCRIANNADALLQLAGKTEQARSQALRWLAEHPEAKTAEEALVAIGISNAPSASSVAQHQKFFNQIEGGWGRLGLAQKRDFLPRIPTLLGTPDLKKRLRDMLSEQLGDMPAASQSAAQTEALKAAFGVLAKLATGDVVEDEEIEAARAETQRAIWGTASTEGAN